MVRGCSLVRCESLAIRHRKRKSRGRFASVNWGSQTGCVRNWLGRPPTADFDIIALYAQCAHFAHFTTFDPGFGLGPNLGPGLAPCLGPYLGCGRNPDLGRILDLDLGPGLNPALGLSPDIDFWPDHEFDTDLDLDPGRGLDTDLDLDPDLAPDRSPALGPCP